MEEEAVLSGDDAFNAHFGECIAAIGDIDDDGYQGQSKQFTVCLLVFLLAVFFFPILLTCQCWKFKSCPVPFKALLHNVFGCTMLDSERLGVHSCK